MEGQLEIISMDGRVMRSMVVTDFNTNIELSEFESGVYFVRYTKENRYSMKRMVIQK
jgi:hypothetical protein